MRSITMEQVPRAKHLLVSNRHMQQFDYNHCFIGCVITIYSYMDCDTCSTGRFSAQSIWLISIYIAQDFWNAG